MVVLDVPLVAIGKGRNSVHAYAGVLRSAASDGCFTHCNAATGRVRFNHGA